MADRDSRVFQLDGAMSANGPLSDVQASAYGEKADFITCDITPTSDSFQPPRTHSAGSWLTSLKNEQLVRSAAFHSLIPFNSECNRNTIFI